MKRLIFMYVPEVEEEKEYDDFALLDKETMDALAEAYREAGYEFGSR